MRLSLSLFVSCVVEVCFILFCLLECIAGGRYPEPYLNGYPGYYDGQQEYVKVNIALEKLEHVPEWINNWPDPSVKMGQVSGVAVDASGTVLVFHRASNAWNERTFSDRNVYQDIGEPPIPHPTILMFNDTGELVDMWGQNLFYMPHGITVDSEGNVWTTDVALHQVFKFTPGQREKPALVLGEKFVPGDDEDHFCKPSAVAVLSSGEFFVADGYCNTRIIKFSKDGTRILQWGKRSGDTPFVFKVPHALTLAEDRGLVCAADRERGRVACFRSDNGTYEAGFRSWLIGSRLFSVAYSPVHGGRLYLVNGPLGNVPVRGYVIDFTTTRLIQTFSPGSDFSNPHDIVISPDGTKVYVAELDPHKVYKFIDDTLRNETVVRNVTTKVKPTATVEVAGPWESGVTVGSSDASWQTWTGAAWGAMGALTLALLALAATALLNARNRGKDVAAVPLMS